MDATVIAVGDELLIGKTVNNNAAYLSRRLAALGIATRRQLVVGDAEADIAAALDLARALTPLAVATGGLGPTEDDRTLAAVAKHLGLELVLGEVLVDLVPVLEADRHGTTLGQFPTVFQKSARITHGPPP